MGDARKRRISVLALLVITVFAAIQYVFIRNIPDTVSTFSFICLTNIIGVVIVCLFYYKHLKNFNNVTLIKGAILAIELLGMNFFMILGTRNMDTVVVASVLSMYFVFINPILRFLKKSVNFFHGIASIIAIIALLLLMGANIGNLTSSVNIIYLLIADAFFASYVITISEFSENENAPKLTVVQMVFTIIFSTIGWVVEVILGKGTFDFPKTPSFWISALFIGLFIRAIYGLVQFSCQKNVPTVIASFIYSSEVVITLLLAPFLNKVFGIPYESPTFAQYAGCFLFIIASLIIDETIMEKLGMGELSNQTSEDNSVAKKFVKLTITFSMLAMFLVIAISVISILVLKNNSIDETNTLGEYISKVSTKEISLSKDLELDRLADDRASMASAKLGYYVGAANYAASIITDLYSGNIDYVPCETMPPSGENKGKWTMQRGLANESISYESVKEENEMLGSMEPVLKGIVNNYKGIAGINIASKSGLMNSYDKFSADLEGSSEIYFDHLSREWFKLAETADDFVFADTYTDGQGKGLMVTCAVPFYNSNGEFQGCVAIDISIDDINHDVVDEGLAEEYYAAIINGNEVVASNFEQNEISEETWNVIFNIVNTCGEDGYKTDEEEDYSYLYEMLSESASVNDIASYHFCSVSTITLTGWNLIIFVPADKALGSIFDMRNEMVSSTKAAAQSIIDELMRIIEYTLIAIACIIIFITIFVGKKSRKISDPIIQLSDDANIIAGGNLDYRSSVMTDDEIGKLANSFNTMTESLQTYIENFKEVTLREQKANSEIQLAAQIQLSSLPYNFPDKDEYSLYATIAPARGVGGDFYDFFDIDETHIGLVIADVSGKGIPASLFMMKSKSLIKTWSAIKKTGAEAFEEVNNRLCDGNDAEMFVTAWLGIVDLEEGVIHAVNAGHEYPAIMHEDGEFELLKDKHGMVLGGLEDMKYTEYTIDLKKGDRIFVYTDGVPEATNASEELFGTERMLKVLNENKNLSDKDLLVNVRTGIDNFVKEAPQFDDITMLVFDYKGK